MSLDLSIDLILPATNRPRLDSASIRDEYQESSWGVKGSRRIRLRVTTLVLYSFTTPYLFTILTLSIHRLLLHGCSSCCYGCEGSQGSFISVNLGMARIDAVGITEVSLLSGLLYGPQLRKEEKCPPLLLQCENSWFNFNTKKLHCWIIG
jgi:hypothetical protein